jgi:hypothetical protein
MLTKNEPMKKEDWMVVVKRIFTGLRPSEQPFRGMGKSSPGRGSGPRLTDRKHYK